MEGREIQAERKIVGERQCRARTCENKVPVYGDRFTQPRYCEPCRAAIRHTVNTLVARNRAIEQRTSEPAVKRRDVFSLRGIQHQTPEKILRDWKRWRDGKVEMV